LTEKYAHSAYLYTVYERREDSMFQGVSHDALPGKNHHLLPSRYTFTLIYGTDKKRKVLTYIPRKEQEGLFLIVYCASLAQQMSRCVYVTGQNLLEMPELVDDVTEASPEENLSASASA